jgi:hypothetical protein
MTTQDKINAFREIPEISKWIKAVDLRLRTKKDYVLRLMQFFEKMNISLGQFLQDCDGNRKQLLSAIEVTLGEIREHSANMTFQDRLSVRLGTVGGVLIALTILRLIPWPPRRIESGRFVIWGTLVATTVYSFHSYFRKKPMMPGYRPAFSGGITTGVAIIGACLRSGEVGS